MQLSSSRSGLRLSLCVALLGSSVCLAQAPGAKPPAPAPAPVPRQQSSPSPSRQTSQPSQGRQGTSAREGSSGRSLNGQEAARISSHLQGERAKASGINHAALPPGRWSENANHTMTLTSGDGRSFVLRPSGSIQSYQSSTGRAQFYANGRVSEMQTKDVYVNNGIGEHRMVARLASGGNVVKLGPSRAYVERPVAAQGRQTIVRTDFVYGRSTTVTYYPFTYGRYQLLFYDPYLLYDPGLYAWMDVGWGSPVDYAWGSPWGIVPAGYGRYYTPAGRYTMPTAWMADYVLTSNLNEAYADPGANGMGANTMAPMAQGPDDDGLPVLSAAVDAPITPAIRDQVIDQVTKQVDAEAQEAKLAQQAGPAAPSAEHMVPAVIDPAVRVFIVHNTLSVVAGTHQCQLTQGDILLHPQPLADNGTAEVLVESSPKGDCPANTVVKVSARDLQEMSNYFKQTITSGEQILASNEGGKLPAPPDAKPIRTLDVPKVDPKSDAALVGQLQTHVADEEATLQQEIASGPTVPK